MVGVHLRLNEICVSEGHLVTKVMHDALFSLNHGKNLPSSQGHGNYLIVLAVI